MLTLRGLTVFFDVDETLHLFKADPTSTDPSDFCVAGHWRHVRALREHSFRGHRIIVWSAGGAQWAEQAVKMLGIEEYVDLCLSKPTWFYDDKRADEFMPENVRVYISDEKSEGMD